MVFLMICLGAYTRLLKMGHSLTGMHATSWKGAYDSFKVRNYIWFEERRANVIYNRDMWTIYCGENMILDSHFSLVMNIFLRNPFFLVKLYD